MIPENRPIRVLIVDDSAVIRMTFRALLEGEPGFEVVGEARDPYEARDFILSKQPDVLTLDIEMPKMDGLTFLRRIMQHLPKPVVIISSVAEKGSAMAMEALQIGAAEVVNKPMTAAERQRFGPTLFAALRAATHYRPRRSAGGPALDYSGSSQVKFIAIGASTGGPAQLFELLPRLPKNLPPIAIVQHMSEGFTAAFAERLARLSGHNVREAQAGELLKPGMIRIAPGSSHLVVSGTVQPALTPTAGPLINYHRPSVDLFFQSTARSVGAAAVGVILTGMGADGAKGLLAMRQAGALTLGQDEASSIVYGMPKAAWEIGGVVRQVSLDNLPDAIVQGVRSRA